MLLQTLSPLVAIIAAFIVAGLIILFLGRNPLRLYYDVFRECFASGYGFAQVLQKTTQLIFAGLAVALAFRAGLFNIGAEGQLYAGSFALAIVAVHLGAAPAGLAIPICILSAMVGGALWAAVPGFLKAFFGAHEVITTIMMNFIAAALMSFFITQPHIGVKGTLHTPEIALSARLPRLDELLPSLHGTTANGALAIALIAAALVWFYLWRTRPGYELRVVGLNPAAALCAGINVKRTIVGAMLLSGALAGLVGTDFVMGYKYYFEDGFSAGIGFIGIAVALLGANHPLGVLWAAFLFGILGYGRIALVEEVPKEMIEILEGLIIIAIVINTKLAQRALIRIHKRRLARERLVTGA
jgi:ABC-type uncharacterized transport system permease subunit